MKFKWQTRGVKKSGTQFSSPTPVVFDYEVETTSITPVTSRAKRIEQETIIVIDELETKVYSNQRSMVHKLLKEKSDGDRTNWRIEEIEVDDLGNPVAVTMVTNKNKVSIRK